MGKTAYLFAGQGSQFPGMMKELYDTVPMSRMVFETADRVLGRPVSGLCFYGTKEKLDLTVNTQPCVLAADLADYYAQTEKTGTPDMGAGFSLGEYGALAAAGVFSLEQVFEIVQKRAEYMQEACPAGRGAMAAVMGLDEKQTAALCEQTGEYVVPANLNCPGQIVVSGTAEGVKKLLEIAGTQRIRAVRLAVSGPFHCDLMKPAMEKMARLLDKQIFCTPRFPVYMNVDGKPACSAAECREKLLRQIASPVRFEDTLRNMKADGADCFIEAGPGKTLSGFVKRTFRRIGSGNSRAGSANSFNQR